MIDVKNVTKTFDGFCALNKLSLHVDEGSVYGLVGPNGAGKTTILKILAGVYRPDEGKYTASGEDIYENTEIKNDIAFISDDLFYFSTYSILETAKYYAGIYKNWNWDRFYALRDIFRIDLNRRVRRLSKGMQKQVAFWIAISTMPKIMLLDEPVDGLDPVMRRNVWKIMLQDVAERKTTILLSSHNLRELEDVCDHVGIMHNGRVVLEKSLDDLRGNTHKIQVAFEKEVPGHLLDDLRPLHVEKFGSVTIIIANGDSDGITKEIAKYSPLIMDILPLTLEEVFIYELGGLGYEFKNIIM